jgi:undecaprenyl-diphosphatase
MDTSLFFLINRGLQNNVLDAVMVFLTNWSYLLFVALLIPLFITDRRKGLFVFLIAALGFFAADGLGGFLKHIIERPRPCQVIPDARLVVTCLHSFSFPSGHSMTSFAAASLIGYYFRKAAVPAFIIAVLVAVSRVYVGVHYPSDVLGGAVLGGAVAGLIIYVRQYAVKSKSR